MTSYNELSQNDTKFLAMTGYTVREFQALLLYFQVPFEEYTKLKTLKGKPRRRRRYCAYKNSPLPTLADKLLFILTYMKQDPTQEMQATLFGMHQSDANAWLHLLHPLLNLTLAILEVLPARTAEALQGKADTVAFYLHDGTERRIPRPTDPTMQTLYYSGKKKCHTVKNLLVVDATCRVLFLSPTWEGKKHDKKVADEAGYQLPEGSTLGQDTGFQGFALPGVMTLQPTKKPRGKELTTEQKEDNRRISQMRIRIEHAIGGVKRYRIVQDKIRNWKPGFRDKVMETCCGLHNFRLNFRPWQYETFKSL